MRSAEASFTQESPLAACRHGLRDSSPTPGGHGFACRGEFYSRAAALIPQPKTIARPLAPWPGGSSSSGPEQFERNVARGETSGRELQEPAIRGRPVHLQREVNARLPLPPHEPSTLTTPPTPRPLMGMPTRGRAASDC